MVLAQQLFGFEEGAWALAFDVALHFGTLIAVVFFYRRRLWDIFSGLLHRDFDLSPREDRIPPLRLTLLLVIATLPSIIVGLGFKHWIEDSFVSPVSTSIQLILTGVILWVMPRGEDGFKGFKNISYASAWWIGVAQAIAILPAISRSGTTIVTALFFGYGRMFAAEFSFLMSIPAILGSVVLEMKNLFHLDPGLWPAILLGMFIACLTGFLSIRWLLGVISRGKLHYFAYYCWVVGSAALIYFLLK